MSNAIKPYLGIMPTIADDVFIADTSSVIGDVHIGAGSSIWYGCVLRGDSGSRITIGKRVNVQDGTVIHLNGARADGAPDMPTIIGDDITIGHSALIHACTLESGCFIGMRSVILDGAVVAPGKVVKKSELWAGTPAKPLRDLRPHELAFWPESIKIYCNLALDHIKSGNDAR